MDKNLDTLCWLLDMARQKGADAADGLLIHSTDTAATHRLGRPEDIERSESTAIGLRVFCGHRQGIVSSTHLSRDSLQEMADRAITIAKAATEDKNCRLAENEFYPASLPELELADNFQPDSKWLLEKSKEIEDAALSVKGITNSEGAQAHHNHSTLCLAAMNSGLRYAHTYDKTLFSFSTSVLAGADEWMERDYAHSSARYHADLLAPQVIGLEAACRTLRRLNPKKMATAPLPVVFDPRTARNLLGVLASSISGSAVARGTSFLKDKMGKDVFAANTNIVDDALMPRGLASRPIDAEGVKTGKHLLVENGVLKSWLLDVRTANKLGLVTTGHASRGLSSPPAPSASNLYMENGNVTPEELMCDIKNGLYVTETFGMGINTVTGNYSQGASGLAIINGQIAHPVSEITIAGNLADMFAAVRAANDLAFRYSTNCPTLRVDGMTIAGV